MLQGNFVNLISCRLLENDPNNCHVMRWYLPARSMQSVLAIVVEAGQAIDQTAALPQDAALIESQQHRSHH